MFCTYLEILKYSSDFREYFNTYYQKDLFWRDYGISNVFMYLYISKSGPSASEVLADFRKNLYESNSENLLIDFYDMQNHLKTVISRIREQLILDQGKKIFDQNSVIMKWIAEEKKGLLQLLNESDKEKKELLQQTEELANRKISNEQTLFQYKQIIAEKERVQKLLQDDILSLGEKNKQIESDLNAIQQSTTWKLTAPIRRLVDWIKKR